MAAGSSYFGFRSRSLLLISVIRHPLLGVAPSSDLKIQVSPESTPDGGKTRRAVSRETPRYRTRGVRTVPSRPWRGATVLNCAVVSVVPQLVVVHRSGVALVKDSVILV